MSSRAVILCSGGMDSVTVLGLVSKKIDECYVLFINYGQKTLENERKAAKTASTKFGAKFKEIELNALKDITETSLIHNSGNTEVQGRNAVLMSLAVAYAQTLKAETVYVGIQEQDVPYKDAQKEFLKDFSKAMKFAYNVHIQAPLLLKNKVEIIHIAKELEIDLNLTYSCYFDPKSPCGTCPSCIARSSAEYRYHKEKK